MSQAIHYVSNLPTLHLIKQLTDIAIKAHGNNPSPVDLKLELAALPAHDLITINEQITNILKANV